MGNPTNKTNQNTKPDKTSTKMLIRAIFSILMFISIACVIAFMIYKIYWIANLNQNVDGYWISLVIGIMIVISLLMLIIMGLIGTIGAKANLVRSYGCNMICVLVLMLVQLAFYVYAYNDGCERESTKTDINSLVDCTENPWDNVYIEIVLIMIFAILSAIVAFVLQNDLKKEKEYDY